MQVWNLLHAARCKYRTQKSRQKSPSGHHRTTSSGYIFATKAHIDNRKKELVKQQYLLHMSLQYGELTIGWDPFVSLGHPCKFLWVSRLGSVTARHLVVGVSHPWRRWTEGATYVRQGGHHVGHWPTFLVGNNALRYLENGNQHNCNEVLCAVDDRHLLIKVCMLGQQHTEQIRNTSVPEPS